MFYEQTDAGRFEALAGLALVLQLVVGGIAFVSGAVFAAVFGLFIVLIQDWLDWDLLRALEFIAPGFAALGIISNPSGAVVPIGEGFARLLPWRSDARETARREKQAIAEADDGRLGLYKSFTTADLVRIEQELGVMDELAGTVRVPEAGVTS
jgi:hypothetical protein